MGSGWDERKEARDRTITQYVFALVIEVEILEAV